MKYIVKVSPETKVATLGNLPDGALAIVLDGEFRGELFFKNVAGLHSISGNRYWSAKGYCGPTSAACRMIEAHDVLTIQEAK